MIATKCLRCHLFWSHNTGEQTFELITKFCPNCLPLIMARLAVPELHGHVRVARVKPKTRDEIWELLNA